MHRDEVEAPMTDWLREAYDFEDVIKEAVDRKAEGCTDAPTSEEIKAPVKGARAAFLR